MTTFFPTESVSLAAGPVDLARMNIAAPADDPFDGLVFVQNSGSATVYWREGTAEPARSDRAHPLAPGAGIVVQLLAGWSFWLWTPSGEAGTISVSPGARRAG